MISFNLNLFYSLLKVLTTIKMVKKPQKKSHNVKKFKKWINYFRNYPYSRHIKAIIKMNRVHNIKFILELKLNINILI